MPSARNNMPQAVTLCDVTGAPHPERRRYAIGDSEEAIAKELLRQRMNLPETSFGRPLRYPPMGATPMKRQRGWSRKLVYPNLGIP